ncbi:hydrogenase iron-sulfur subunit [bacterium]|nr:hydrogenase iron-sulfur subunit [bacterium]
MIMEEFARKILAKIGIDKGRFVLKWASAAEGPRFVKLITDFTDRIKSIGPLGESEGIGKDELQIKLLAARSALEKTKLRTGLGNLTKGFRKQGDYSDQIIKDKVNEKLTKSIGTEIDKNETLLRIQNEGPISFDELTKKTGVSGTDIEKYVAAFSKKGLVVETDGKLSGIGD